MQQFEASSGSTTSAVVEAAAAQIRELKEQLWAAKSPQELVDTTKAFEQLRSTLDGVEVGVIEQIDATNAAVVDQWGSTRDFVTAVSGSRRGHGAGQVRLAKDLCGDRTATREAMVAGWLSRDKAKVIVRTITLLPSTRDLREQAEALMLELAQTLGFEDLRGAGEELLERLDPDGCAKRDEAALARAERAAHQGRYLSIIDDGMGGVRIKGRGTTEDAAVIKAALLPLTKPDPAADHTDQTNPSNGPSGPDGNDGAGQEGAGHEGDGRADENGCDA
jgi:hypothetical protein